MNDHWWSVFSFARDGVSGSELLGLFLVFGMTVLLWYVQVKETGNSKRVDLSWMFLDDKTQKVSRSGFIALGGFLVGSWVIVDAEGTGHLDWSAFGVFLTYCAGVRAIEVFKPKENAADQPAIERTTTTREVVQQGDVKPDAPLEVNVVGMTDKPLQTKEKK